MHGSDAKPDHHDIRMFPCSGHAAYTICHDFKLNGCNSWGASLCQTYMRLNECGELFSGRKEKITVRRPTLEAKDNNNVYQRL